jgi:hypothetical protein
MGFRESVLRRKIAGLKRNIAKTEKVSPNTERLQELREQLAIAEAQLEKLKHSN